MSSFDGSALLIAKLVERRLHDLCRTIDFIVNAGAALIELIQGRLHDLRGPVEQVLAFVVPASGRGFIPRASEGRIAVGKWRIRSGVRPCISCLFIVRGHGLGSRFV